jgi:hypothetical protein
MANDFQTIFEELDCSPLSADVRATMLVALGLKLVAKAITDGANTLAGAIEHGATKVLR